MSASAEPMPSSSALMAAFAPGATTIWFSPDGDTEISAMPVDSLSTTRTPDRSTPPSRNRASASFAAASSPTHATSLTCAPSRLAASAWLAPLPPGNRLSVAPVTVSPGAGNRDTVAERSRFTEPMTTTSVMSDPVTR